MTTATEAASSPHINEPANVADPSYAPTTATTNEVQIQPQTAAQQLSPTEGFSDPGHRARPDIASLKPPELGDESKASYLYSVGHADSVDDNDNDHERPVREKLKKTSIGTLPKHKTESTALQGNELQMQQANASVEHPPSASSETGLSQAKYPSAWDNNFKRSISGDSLERARPLLRGTYEPNDVQLSSTPTATLDELETLGEENSTTVDKEKGDGLSRPSTPSSPAQVEIMEEDPIGRVMSPRKKRSRDQFDDDHEKESGKAPLVEEDAPRSSEDTERDPNPGGSAVRTTRDEPEKKRHRDISQDSTGKEQASAQISSKGPFSNTSAISPFGSLGAINPSSSRPVLAPKSSGDAQPSTSSFATSSFAALSGMGSSPFGTLGMSSAPSGFGTLSTSGDKRLSASSLGASGTSPNASGLGGLPSMSSGFGTETSGFGKLGAGLGGGFGVTGPGLTSFASKGGTGIIGLSQAPAREFGAPDELDDEDEEEDLEKAAEHGNSGKATTRDGKDDRRFQHQEVETGEEGEETRFSGRAKLFYFDNATKAWKERGFGVLKLNVSCAVSEETDDVQADSSPEPTGSEHSEYGQTSRKLLARLLMRSEGVYRVVLNVPIFKALKAGDQNGELPSDRCIKFTALEDERHVMMQLRFGNNATASELWRRIKEVQEEM